MASDPGRAAAALRRAGFRGQDLVRAVAIAGRESRWDNEAQNLNAGTGDHSIGYMQINQLAHKGRFGTDQQLKDPDTNARAAYALFKQAGWQPWTTNSKVDNLDLDRARQIVGGTGTVSSTPTRDTSYGLGAAAASSTGTDKQGAVLDALMNRRPGQSLAKGIISNLRSGNFQTTTTEPGVTAEEAGNVTEGAAPAAGGRPDSIQALMAEADRIDAAELPYQWGGGHTRRLPHGSKQVALDCSGAVSRVLGIDPRVSGAFEGWGEAGEGRHVTIYANAKHVFMKIDGKFFGTSRSNPGGGAGWIPASAVDTSGFVVRHPVGM